MARKRFIDPGMWQDAAVAKMTHEERLLFVGMISIADDEGRLIASPASLLGTIYPNDNGKVAAAMVKKWRDAVAAKCPNVQMYLRDGIEYVSFRKWDFYQRPSHPTRSKLPSPPRGMQE